VRPAVGPYPGPDTYLNLNVNSTVNVTDNTIAIGSGSTMAVGGTLRLTSATATVVPGAGATVNLGVASVLDLNNRFAVLTDGRTYGLFTGAGMINGNFGSITGYDSTNFTASFDNTTDKVTFTAVPEPSTYGLLGAGAQTAAAAVRRRRVRGKVASPGCA